MPPFRSLRAGLRALFHKEAVSRELDDEIALFVDEATRANIRAGMPPADAARAARARVGSGTAVRERALSGGWETAIESLVQDVRFGVRGMRRNLALTTAAILTIALGVGANTAVFSVVDAVVLRPLPWRDADRLTLLQTDDVRRALHREPTAWRTIADWSNASRTVGSIAYFATQRVTILPTDPGGDRGRSRSALISANLFPLLGVAPLRGRVISAADESQRAAVAVISFGFWQRELHGTAAVLGRTITLDDAAKGGASALTIVGVMPEGFYFPDRLTEIWTPATTWWRFERESVERFPSWARRWTAVGRLADGTSVDDAHAEFTRIGERLAATYQSSVPDFPGFGVTLTPIRDVIVGQNVRATLWVLLGAVGVVLLIACANVANLLLARGSARQQELVLRRALGAARIRVARQLIVESLVLSLAGGALGALVAVWGSRLLGVSAAAYVPRIDEMAVDWRVLVFAAGTSVVAGIVFGIAPALRFSGVDARESLSGAARTVGPRGTRTHRDWLVGAECALALVLLTGAGLLVRSLVAVQNVNPGFDPDGVLTVRVEFPPESPPTAAERAEGSPVGQLRGRARLTLATAVGERVRAIPGVTDVGFVDDLYRIGAGNTAITIPGRIEETGAGELTDGTADAGFFSTLRVPVRAGRLLTTADAEQKLRALYTPVNTALSLAEKERQAVAEPVVVNAAFAKEFFSGQDPVGKRFCVEPTGKTYWYEIVGVIGDMHREGLEHRPIPEWYGPWIPSANGRVDLLVRAPGNPLALGPQVRDAVMRVLPGATVVSISTADAQLGDFSALRRLQTWLFTAFALLALVLAAIGIFGVVWFAVTERTREIGVRLALGASPAQVMVLILGQGLRTPALGIAFGVIGSLAFTRVLSSFLFGVTATDPATFVGVAALLAGIATAACWLAGRGALRVDPVTALRDG